MIKNEMKKLNRKKRALNYIRTKNNIRKRGYWATTKVPAHTFGEDFYKFKESFANEHITILAKKYKLKPIAEITYDMEMFNDDFLHSLMTLRLKIIV